MTEHNLIELKADVETLAATVRAEGETIAAAWAPWIERPEFKASAANLADYLALRRRDIRPLQRRLMAHGLSSLGRLESRVQPTLNAVLAALDAFTDAAPRRPLPSEAEFFDGEHRLAERTTEILGPVSQTRAVHLLITCPPEAAEGPEFMRRLARMGVEAVRINCAHDDAAAWGRMIGYAREASAATGRPIKILMDLAGPKIRTGLIRPVDGHRRVGVDDLFAIAIPGQLDKADEGLIAVECTLPQALMAAKPGERIFVDDGKLATVVESVSPWGVTVRVTTSPDEDGYKLKEEKGVNFPDTHFSIPALTEKDIVDLAFIAEHADGIEFSFVQSEEDVAALHRALERIRPDWRKLSLILKIETTRALGNLPDILARAAGRQPTAIMIARGDLAVEIGFSRLAEMQEELLWIGEAAQVPVIWATQVLEHLIKKGVPLRGEMTDAAMSARAECVMLNKGPNLFAAITELDTLLSRMSENQYKKAPRLRRLTSW
ncbi:pyruvate kinase [Kaistia dalseonensis]|uniref:Pyruvate kinase n=1 Tax=Kaistia dalseonensis TaxID=410840 RepID=A0ABU0HF25_9HYPH|nr:pyruvate kinase [Kaistia dalseonensis]MCX5497472.1 pyruvate kinase [Kaistia dalseonensis]MDQ0440111.1 pyruvate kinase [Kaistia dalseonensis]